MTRKFLLTIAILCVLPLCASAQKVSMSTNAVDWAWYGTANGKLDFALARHFSAGVNARYNPWQFQATDPDYPIKANQLSASAGITYWPWVVFSGSHISLYGQYRIYSETGILRPSLDQSTTVGGILSFGYCWMLSRHLNLDITMGGFGGYYLDHTLYCCPEHLSILKSGPGLVIRPEDICISLAIVF